MDLSALQRIRAPRPPIVGGSPYLERMCTSRVRQPQLLVVHSMSEWVLYKGAWHHASRWLTDPDLPGRTSDSFASADVLVDPAGALWLLNNEDETHRYTWHAGKSAWGDLPRRGGSLNHVSLGVEVLVPGRNEYAQWSERIKRPSAFSLRQYRSTGYVLATWADAYGLTFDDCVRHSTISGPDVRPDPKIDPGAGFDWSLLQQRFDEYMTAYYRR